MQMPGMLEESRSRVFAGSHCWLRGNCGHRIHWALTEIDMAGRHRSRTARWVQRILLGDLLRVACNLSATLSGRRDRGRRECDWKAPRLSCRRPRGYTDRSHPHSASECNRSIARHRSPANCTGESRLRKSAQVSQSKERARMGALSDARLNAFSRSGIYQ
jgi:hypothetical protein